jgi:hypothetical protein
MVGEVRDVLGWNYKHPLNSTAAEPPTQGEFYYLSRTLNRVAAFGEPVLLTSWGKSTEYALLMRVWLNSVNYPQGVFFMG